MQTELERQIGTKSPDLLKSWKFVQFCSYYKEEAISFRMKLNTTLEEAEYSCRMFVFLNSFSLIISFHLQSKEERMKEKKKGLTFNYFIQEFEVQKDGPFMVQVQ